MRTRRQFLATLGAGITLTGPLPALAQPAGMRRVGILVPAPRAGYEDRLEALRGGPRDLGYVDAGRLGALPTAKRLPSVGLDAVAFGGGLLSYGVSAVAPEIRLRASQVIE
jgi:hypothetical protein